MPKDTREPQEIIAHIITSRVELSSTIYGLSETELTVKGAVGEWSVKDVMAHIGRWEVICIEQLQKHLGGEPSVADYRDALAYNDMWEAELQSLTLLEAIALFETSHYRLFGFISSLEPEQWNGYVRAWVRGSTWHHFEEHCEQIRAWRTSR
jgi:Protein of unknown function (DUF1706)